MTQGEAGNDALTELFREGGFSRAGLARRVNDASARLGTVRRYDKTSVAHWLGGRVPRDPIPRLICDVLSERLTRPITLADAGFPDPPGKDPGRSLVFAPSLEETIEVVSDLVREDMERRRFLKRALVSGTALGLAGRDWLVSPADGDVSHRGTRRVSPADVAWLQAAAEQYRHRDLQVGGGDLRSDVVALLSRHVGPMLRGSYTDPVGRDLLSTAADVCALAGWMAYDEGSRPIASRYYVQALRLAKAADDPQVAAQVLTRMSFLALDEGLSTEAIAQARTAGVAAAATGNRRVQAYVHIVEARTQAVAGRRREALEAVARARFLYDPSDVDAPGWALIHDPAELANQLAHIHLDLRDPAPGLSNIAVAIDGKDDSKRRSLAKCHVRAARLHIVDGDIEAVLEHTSQVSLMLPGLSSTRVHRKLGPVRQELVAVTGARSRYVTLFDERVAAG